MVRDTKKNSAYESGLRGKEKPRTGAPSQEPTLADGATSVRVSRADNGYIVECSYPGKKRKGQSWPDYTPPTQHVFSTAADVAAFIEETLGVEDADDKKE